MAYAPFWCGFQFFEDWRFFVFFSFTDDCMKLVTLEDDDVIKACRAFCDVPNKDAQSEEPENTAAENKK